MKNLIWEKIGRPTSKDGKYMKKSSLEYCKALSKYSISSSIEPLDRVGNIKTISREGRFIYEDGEVVQVLRNQNKLEHYSLKGEYLYDTTVAKKFEIDDVKYKTDLISIGKSAITGGEVFGRYIDDNLYVDFSGVVLDVKMLEGDDNIFINGELINAKDIFEEKYYSLREQRGYSMYGSNWLDKNKIKNYLPSEYRIVNEEHKIDCYISKVVMYKNNFCFSIGDSSNEYYEIPTFSKGNMRYAMVDGIFYYVVLNKDLRKCNWEPINSEYSKFIEGFYVRIDLGEVVFENKPYSKYPRLYNTDNKDILVIGCNQYPISYDDFDFVLGEIKTNDSPYSLVSKIKDKDIIIPYHSIFLIISEEEIVYIYDKMHDNFGGLFAKSGLEKFENIKYEQKESCFYMLDSVLYVKCDGYGYKLSLDEYREDTVKVINPTLLTIENKNGENEMISIFGMKTKLKNSLSNDDLMIFNTVESK